MTHEGLASLRRLRERDMLRGEWMGRRQERARLEGTLDFTAKHDSGFTMALRCAEETGATCLVHPSSIYFAATDVGRAIDWLEQKTCVILGFDGIKSDGRYTQATRFVADIGSVDTIPPPLRPSSGASFARAALDRFEEDPEWQEVGWVDLVFLTPEDPATQ